MPWCEDCSRFWNAGRVGAEGKCPTCGRVLTKTKRRAPWHFKLMLAALAVYMAYRIYWLAVWLPKHVHL